MLVTASTVKDTLPNLRSFVDRNLAGGVDHLMVFVDDFDPATTAALNEHPHVTAIATGPGWWHGKRPQQLNVRQRINANVARALLCPFGWAEWLWHIDSDECLQVDRSALAALPPTVTTVRAETREAVSRKKWPGNRVTHFKHPLEPDELVLLQVLGVVEEPTNGHYFHGHIEGKPGMRPTLDQWLTLHLVQDVTETTVAAHRGQEARVLHYESWSGEDFVRKWTAILGSGSRISFRPVREPVAVALRTLVTRGLTEKQARPYLMRIYERTTEDDFETLLELGMLEEVDPLRGGHRPEAMGAERGRALDSLVAALQPENKWPFHTGRTAAAMVATLAGMADRVAEEDPVLAETVRAAWRLPDDVLARSAGLRSDQRPDQGSA